MAPAVVPIDCGGIEVLLREFQTGGTGNRLWPASHALLRYILGTVPDLAETSYLELYVVASLRVALREFDVEGKNALQSLGLY